MEPKWAQKIRSIVNEQKNTLVEAIIDNEKHIVLKKRDGDLVDAGEIKVRPPGSIVYIAQDIDPTEPDIYFTKDGSIWNAPASEGRFQLGRSSNVNSGCWTGDRFLVEIYRENDDASALLQSRDGGIWNFHPDKVTFSLQTSGYIHGMDATGNGLVIAVGQKFGPAPYRCNIAISYDFGETWIVLPNDDSRYPFAGLTLDGICIKNEFEWVVLRLDHAYYTRDGGGHWSEIVYPDELSLAPFGYNGKIKYFNGYWWFYGQGSGSGEWDTPLIKSEDLVNWIPVVTPWSGTYPPVYTYNNTPPRSYGPHNWDSGNIINLECDPLTNTMIAIGESSVPSSTMIMMSTDGGENWFEVGYKKDDTFRVDYGWDGVYTWPDNWVFEFGGAAFGFGWWFCALESFATPVINSKVFSYTGAMERFVVPDNINTLSVQVKGAQGSGGNGTKVVCDLPVVPGKELNIFVGGTLGWNGRISDIRIDGTTLDDRIIIAATGGGSSMGTDINQTITDGFQSGNGEIIFIWTITRISPPLIRISSNGKFSEPVYPALKHLMQGHMLISGGNVH